MCLADSLTHSQTLKDSATQLLIKYKSGALVTQLDLFQFRSDFPLKLHHGEELKLNNQCKTTLLR